MAKEKDRHRSLKSQMKRVYVFKHPTDFKSHYVAQVYPVRCVDDRCWKTYDRFLKDNGITKLDPKTPAGAAKVFASPEKPGDRDYNLRELAISIRLHKVKTVWLMNHSHCGAYGGIERFGGDEDKEFELHAKELRKARRVILEKFPKLKVKIYFIDATGIIEVSPEKKSAK